MGLLALTPVGFDAVVDYVALGKGLGARCEGDAHVA